MACIQTVLIKLKNKDRVGLLWKVRDKHAKSIYLKICLKNIETKSLNKCQHFSGGKMVGITEVNLISWDH